MSAHHGGNSETPQVDAASPVAKEEDTLQKVMAIWSISENIIVPHKNRFEERE